METPVPSSLPKNKRRRGNGTPQVSEKLGSIAEAVSNAVKAICEKYNYEPLEEMVKLRMTKVPLFRNGKEVLDEKGQVVWVPLCGMDEAVGIDKEICKYVHSQKPRAVDMNLSGQQGIAVLVAPLTAAPEKPVVPALENTEGEDDL